MLYNRCESTGGPNNFIIKNHEGYNQFTKFGTSKNWKVL